LCLSLPELQTLEGSNEKELPEGGRSIYKRREIMLQTKKWVFHVATLKKEMGMFRGFLAIFLIIGAFGGQAVAGEFLDGSTQHEILIPFPPFGNKIIQIHICRGGSFMTGVHVKDNRFLCEDGIKYPRGRRYSPSDIKVNRTPDHGPARHYQSHGMAACPPGTAMVGLHEDRNVLLCAPLETTELFVDSHTQRLGMHACPKGSVMVGIHVGRNLLLCGRLR
jgi:hypothetical protein